MKRVIWCNQHNHATLAVTPRQQQHKALSKVYCTLMCLRNVKMYFSKEDKGQVHFEDGKVKSTLQR